MHELLSEIHTGCLKPKATYLDDFSEQLPFDTKSKSIKTEITHRNKKLFKRFPLVSFQKLNSFTLH